VSKRLTTIQPDNAALHANLGEYYRRSGKLTDAKLSLTKALALNDANAQAHNNLGIVHYDSKSFDDAVACYRRALELQPKFPEASNNLGNALRALGKTDEAIASYQDALLLREVYPEAYNNLGTSLRDKGSIPEAEHAYRKAVQQAPRYLDAYVNLAVLLDGNGKGNEALRVLGDALRVDPNHTGAILQTARVQMGLENYATAEQAARMVLARNSSNIEALVLHAQALHELDRMDECLASARRAVDIDPASAEAQNFYGIALKSAGRLDEAREHLLKGVMLNPDAWGAVSNLHDLVDFKDHPELVARMEQAFADAGPEGPTAIPLYYAHAKALDDQGRHAEALERYVAGGRLQRQRLTYNEERSVEFVDSIIEMFPAEVFADRKLEGNKDERPVFIVGMPRSGSTLIEQILASHPEFYGAGEVKYLSGALNKLRDRFPSLPVYPQIATNLQQPQLDYVAETYLNALTRDAGGAKRVTDKLLSNYLFVGMINIAFPNAKIIHSRRNPVDTCLSAFTKLFKDDMPHSYDLGELGRYYRNYERLMAHWASVIPANALMTMDYEEVVSDVEAAARKLTDFLGVEYDAQCVDFHKSDRPVRTASVAQVRKPVYKTAVERWRRYGDGLQELLDALQYKA
jgi:tetratricopeptide (TPR) repeat protein